MILSYFLIYFYIFNKETLLVMPHVLIMKEGRKFDVLSSRLPAMQARHTGDTSTNQIAFVSLSHHLIPSQQQS